MEKVITITKIEEKTKGENKWITVTAEDGKTDNLFPNIIENWEDKVSYVFEGSTVKLILKKPDGAKYWNVCDVQPSGVKEAVQKDQSAQYATKAIAEKEKDERTAIMCVKDLRCAGVPLPLTVYASTLTWIAKNLGVETGNMELWVTSHDDMFAPTPPKK